MQSKNQQKSNNRAQDMSAQTHLKEEQNFEECHLCKLEYIKKAQQNKEVLIADQINSSPHRYQLPKCCMRKCYKKYCLNCISERFDPSFQYRMYKADTWICYSCQKRCPCVICKGLENDKKISKKKNNTAGSKQDLKAQIEIEKQQKIQDFYSEQQIGSSMPFMKKIYERRNHLYRLMANSYQQQINKKSDKQSSMNVTVSVAEENSIDERPSTNIKDLISNTLKNYSDDQNDIQLI